jgi:hypothetical protein
MRVGISGTHGTGKTTLAGALCAHLPGHVMADEPYYLLEEEGHEFGFPPSLEDYRALLARSLRSADPASRAASKRTRTVSCRCQHRRPDLARTGRDLPATPARTGTDTTARLFDGDGPRREDSHCAAARLGEYPMAGLRRHLLTIFNCGGYSGRARSWPGSHRGGRAGVAPAPRRSPPGWAR